MRYEDGGVQYCAERLQSRLNENYLNYGGKIMVYLMRHGQTDWNLFKRANGCTDTFLNKTGIEQGRLLAEELKDVRFDACYCSPQARARQFCEIVYKGSIEFDDRLVEINCGEFEGMEETEEMGKSFLQAIQTGERGTESISAFIKRNAELCDEIIEVQNGKNVLIVTHAANARVINYCFNGKPKDYDFSKRVVDSGKYILLAN